MYLSTIKRIYKRPNNKEIEAYKVFVRNKLGNYEFEFRRLNGGRLVPLNEWLVAEQPFSWISNGYPCGFYAFKDKKSAKQWSERDPSCVVVKVRLRKILAAGYQTWIYGLPTYVAGEMYVPKPRKRKKK